MSYILNTDTQTRTIFLDSATADSIMEQSTSDSNVCYSSYKWYLNTPVTCLPSQRMIISLIDAQFPNIFYNIRSNVNNYLNMIVGGTTYTLYIAEGYYNIETLCSYLSARLPVTFTINYVNYTLQLSTSGSSFRIYGDSTIGGVLGLNRSSDGSYQTAISFANTLTMPCTFNLSGTPYIFVKISNLTLDNIDGGDNQGSISRIDLNAPYGRVCFFRPAVIDQYLIQTRMIDHFNIYLTDHYGIPLCLKNSNIQLTMRIQYIQAPELPDVLSGTIEQEIKNTDYKIQPIPMEYYLLENEQPETLGT
jgi:hypothetical protein